MRIPIREQLGLLVLLTSLIALAVVAIATVIPLIHILLPSPLLIFPSVGHQLQICCRDKVSCYLAIIPISPTNLMLTFTPLREGNKTSP